LTGREIAEAIWLAVRAEDDDLVTIDVPVQPDSKEEKGLEVGADVLLPEMNVDISAPPASAEIVPAPVAKTPSVALPPNYKPIPVPDAPALSQPLLLARALRPLARHIAVGLPTLVDETATVDRVAETGVWQPVLKPESELWLDVALVFDTSPSMCLWQRLGTDIHRLLSRYGEFRDVRVWRLRHAAGKVELTSRNGTIHKPSELLTGDRPSAIAWLRHGTTAT